MRESRKGFLSLFFCDMMYYSAVESDTSVSSVFVSASASALALASASALAASLCCFAKAFLSALDICVLENGTTGFSLVGSETPVFL